MKYLWLSEDQDFGKENHTWSLEPYHYGMERW
jgi:hypothetical protein